MDRRDTLKTLAQKTKKALHLYGWAMEERAVGTSEDALKIFEEIETLHPDYVPARFMKAQVLEELGRLEEASRCLEVGISLAVAEGDDFAANEMRSMLDTLEAP